MILTTRLVMKNLEQITMFGMLGIIAILVLVTSIQTTTFAETEENSVNDISIKTVFLFNHGEEEINTFKVFRQIDGFMGQRDPSFELQGIVDGGHPLLYEEAHQQHHYKALTQDKRDFDVMVSLIDGGVTNVHFSYTSCDIVEYFVKTSIDVNQKVWSGMTPFPHVETFVFECNGFDPLHQIDDPERPIKTTATDDEIVKEIPSWIKQNAAWWAQGLISDDEYVQGIKFLAEQGIIKF